MAYAEINFKTKKALKDAVKNTKVYAYNPGLGSDLSNYTGRIALEGPHYPEAHKWYADCDMKNGVVVKVR